MKRNIKLITTCIPVVWQDSFRDSGMNSVLNIIAATLLLVWLVGVIGYSVGGFIHVLLLFAIASLLLSIIGRKTSRS